MTVFETLPTRNFSGRTALLRKRAGLDAAEFCGTQQYLGPDIGNFLSGLAQTVQQELYLHRPGWQNDVELAELCKLVGLEQMLDRNPFSLSGGEQTMLCLATALARSPDGLLVDSALEQLDPATRLQCLERLGCQDQLESIALADNRLSEFADALSSRTELTVEAEGVARPRPELRPDAISCYEPHPTVIELRGVDFGYAPGEPILQQLSLRFEPGHIHLLTGPNGAGKTTLCRLLAGLYAPGAGQLFANDQPTRFDEKPASICAYHFQNPDVQLFEITVKAELRASLPAGARANRLDEILTAFGLEDFADTHPMDLPFTLRKRLAIAAAYAMERPWLILDEPTLGQDDETVDALLEMLRYLAEQSCGIILVTHSERLMTKLQGHVLTLKRQPREGAEEDRART